MEQIADGTTGASPVRIDIDKRGNEPVTNTTKLSQLLRTRIATLSRWINRHCPDCESEQAHLEEGTREQAYWNYGYLVALRDILRKISATRTSNARS
jgi:hypothetical protein